ncbi:hypothetical protein FD720_04165, partial [Photobacterium damselae subsp. damselae]|jgi:RHS repeat-associated protein
VDVLYVYGLDGELLAEVDAGTGQTQREYVWLDGQLVAYLVDGTVYHVHNDHLGTPQALTDETGATVWKASYSPFGKATVTTEQIKFNLRFPGQYYDAETGLHYNWHRYYDPSLGRYLQSDRLGLFDGMDTYGYVRGNPLVWSDPTGQFVPQLAGFIAGGGVSAFSYWEKYKCGSISGAEYLASIAIGAGAGAISSGASVIDGALIALAGNVAEQYFVGDEFSYSSMGMAGGIAALSGKAGQVLGKSLFPSKYITVTERRWYTLFLYKHKKTQEVFNADGRAITGSVVAGGVTGGIAASFGSKDKCGCSGE